MNKNVYVDWEDFSKDLLKQPGFKEALKETEIEFQIARAIIEARIKRGMTQEDLATKLHTKQSVISRVENAKTVPSVSFLKRIADVLNTPLIIQFGV